MRYISLAAIMAFLLLAMSSCAPTTYTVTGERQSIPEHHVDFENKIPGIVTLNPKEGTDSLLVSSFAIGIAEQIEADLSMEAGSIPVYYLYKEEVDMNDPLVMKDLSRQTGTDVIIVVDSMHIGEYSVTHPQEMVYHESGFMRQTMVSLPFGADIYVYKVDSSFVDSYKLREVSEWTMLSEDAISDVRAVEEINKNLGESFMRTGITVAQDFTVRWETFTIPIYVYDNATWWDACRHAYLFEWNKAMEIWLEEADSNNERKAACAAYNISVACKMLEMDDLAWEWKIRADKLMGHDSTL